MRHDSRKRQWFAVAAGFTVSTLLLAETGLSDDPRPRGDSRVEAVRKDLQRYNQLVQEAKRFFALPAAEQDAMRKLDDDLSKLPYGERERLLTAMQWYAGWLDKLPAKEREEILKITDKNARVLAIRDRMERDWIERQPRATKQLLEKLPKGKPAPPSVAASLAGMLAPGSPARPLASVAVLFEESIDLRAETIRHLKRYEAAQARNWQIASRFWPDLSDPDLKKRLPMPAKAADFGPDVELFVKEYLRPALSAAEREQLDNAEGHWPLYPMTLVELADKHPLALPQKLGPVAFDQLPTEIQKNVHATIAVEKDKSGKAKNVPDFTKQGNNQVNVKRMQAADPNPSSAMKYACAVANFFHIRKQGLRFELWAGKYPDLSAPMKSFLDPDGAFVSGLTKDEQEELTKLSKEIKWPEYPLRIKHLAEKYGFKPPWQSLPDPADPKHNWDKYRVQPLTKTSAAPPPRQPATATAWIIVPPDLVYTRARATG
jgi:hypothetical protein